MDPEEAFGLLKVIGRLSANLDAAIQENIQLKVALKEARNGVDSGEVVHSDQREADHSGGDTPDGGS